MQKPILETRIPKNGIIFAPLEGITNTEYRNAILTAYPEWDYVYTSFLRIPKVSNYRSSKIINSISNSNLGSDQFIKKTALQVLTDKDARNEYHFKLLNDIPIEHVDLNLGCPSKVVNRHGGGAYLLDDLTALTKIITVARKNYNGLLSCKIRLGYNNANNFNEIIKILSNEGIDLIAIHARTRSQMYKGKSNWSYFDQATELTDVPIVANGDIWSKDDMLKVLENKKIYAIMLGRPALKTPWIPYLYKNKKIPGTLIYYFNHIKTFLEKSNVEERIILKKFKAVSRDLFIENKTLFFRTKTIKEFEELLIKFKL